MPTSLFEQLGGAAAVDAAVDIFYRKVLKDKRIAHFFDSVNMDGQRAKQKAFLTMAFGGPRHYTGKDMRAAHAHLVARGLTDVHFDAVAENLQATLRELKVAEPLVKQVIAIAASTRSDVLGR
jgi:hemoglobin